MSYNLKYTGPKGPSKAGATRCYIFGDDMRISEKKGSSIYKAISEPITKKRITVIQSEDVNGKTNAKDVDELLYKLELEIWREVRNVLGIS